MKYLFLQRFNNKEKYFCTRGRLNACARVAEFGSDSGSGSLFRKLISQFPPTILLFILNQYPISFPSAKSDFNFRTSQALNPKVGASKPGICRKIAFSAS
jgi:hypothetical protein